MQFRLLTNLYPTDEAMLDEDARVGLFAAVPGSRSSHEAAVAAEIDRLAPDPATAKPPAQKPSTRMHEGLLVVALLLALAVPAVVFPSLRTGTVAFRLETWLLWSGVFAAASTALYMWLEPYRRSTRLWAQHGAVNVLFLCYPVIWAFTLVQALTRWDEIGSSERTGPVIGCVLLGGSIIAMLVMFLRARRTDASIHAEMVRLLSLPEAQRDEFLATMDRWWRDAGAAMSLEQREAARRGFVVALDVLAEKKVMDADAVRRAMGEPVDARWREERW